MKESSPDNPKVHFENLPAPPPMACRAWDYSVGDTAANDAFGDFLKWVHLKYPRIEAKLCFLEIVLQKAHVGKLTGYIAAPSDKVIDTYAGIVKALYDRGLGIGEHNVFRAGLPLFANLAKEEDQPKLASELRVKIDELRSTFADGYFTVPIWTEQYVVATWDDGPCATEDLPSPNPGSGVLLCQRSTEAAYAGGFGPRPTPPKDEPIAESWESCARMFGDNRNHLCDSRGKPLTYMAGIPVAAWQHDASAEQLFVPIANCWFGLSGQWSSPSDCGQVIPDITEFISALILFAFRINGLARSHDIGIRRGRSILHQITRDIEGVYEKLKQVRKAAQEIPGLDVETQYLLDDISVTVMIERANRDRRLDELPSDIAATFRRPFTAVDLEQFVDRLVWPAAKIRLGKYDTIKQHLRENKSALASYSDMSRPALALRPASVTLRSADGFFPLLLFALRSAFVHAAKQVALALPNDDFAAQVEIRYEADEILERLRIINTGEPGIALPLPQHGWERDLEPFADLTAPWTVVRRAQNIYTVYSEIDKGWVTVLEARSPAEHSK